MMADFDLIEAANDLCKKRMQWVDDAYAFKSKVAPFSQSIKAVVRLMGDKIWVQLWSEKIDIHINVDDMKSVSPLIESLQDIIGKEFGKTEDDTIYSISRTFTMIDFPLQVVAHVNKETESGGEKCKAV